MSFLYSIIAWPIFIVMTFVLVTIGIPFGALGYGIPVYRVIGKVWSNLSLLIFAIRYEMIGKEKIDPKKNYVFMGNHQSYADIFLMLANLSNHFMFMAKKELFKIPFFGYAIRKMGLIPVDRGNSKEALKSLLQAAKTISSGYSVMLFPEGTRSTDGRMLPFKRGAFMLAVRSGQAIVPFYIENSGKILSKGSFFIHPFKKVRIHILDVIEPGGFKEVELLEQVREALEKKEAEFLGTGTGQ